MRWAAVIALALVAVPAASGKALPPCSLLTDAQVGHVLGQKVQFHQAGRGYCVWHLPPLGNFTSASAQVMVFVQPQTEPRFRRQERANPGAAPVPGVGTLAYWLPGSAVQELVAWHGGYAVTVYASRVTNQLRTEKAIAAIALARLS